jgi:hypothetical protein
MHRHFVVVIDNWMFENWHLYHWQQTGNKKYQWMEYKKVF